MTGFDNVRENLRTILTVSAVFFAILVIFQLNGWTLEEKNQPPKEVVQVLKLEAFSNGGQNNNCVIYVACCGYLNGSKCVSGSASGPTFLSNVGGEKIVVDEWIRGAK